MERSSALFFLAFGVLLLLVVLPLGIQVGPVAPGQLGPAFVPRLLAIAITATALLLLLQGFRRGAPAAAATEAKEGPLRPALARLLLALTLVLYVPAIALVGFVAASVPAVILTMLIFGERRPWIIALVALPVPLLMWLFATRVLNVTMP